MNEGLARQWQRSITSAGAGEAECFFGFQDVSHLAEIIPGMGQLPTVVVSQHVPEIMLADKSGNSYNSSTSRQGS